MTSETKAAVHIGIVHPSVTVVHSQDTVSIAKSPGKPRDTRKLKVEERDWDLRVDELDWEGFRKRGLATSSADLPPHDIAVLRGVHYAHPMDVESILAYGLDYAKYYTARYTVVPYTNGRREVPTVCIPANTSWGPGHVAIVLEFSWTEWERHNRAGAPGIIDPR